MFIIEYNGGLGNQMFEFAFMKQLERTYPQTRIRVNISDKRHYELDRVFGIVLNECSKREAACLSEEYPKNAPYYAILNKLFNIRRILFGPKNTCIHQDDYTCFYPEYYHLNPLNWYYFKGVWANSQYLIGIEKIVKDSFRFKGELTEQNKKYIYEMSKCNSVSIHVRRGDYVTLGMPLLGEKYYLSAIKYISDKITTPKFFVFSNDIEYCKKIFNEYKDFVYIEGNTGTQNYIDMQLMSMCRHNIISNSTFSFWGAYLNNDPDKIVITPNRGVGAEGTKDFNTPFACPEWIKIDV